MLSSRLVQFRSICLPVVLCSRHRRNIHVGKQLRCSSKPELYDVVVCGGGMVGTAMAAALGHEPMFEGKRVLLLEAGPKQNYNEPLPEKFFNRTCSLNAGAVSLLRSFGAWENIMKARCQEVKRMQIWDACSDSIITFNHDSLENLAYVAENNVILAGILKQLDAAGDRVHVKYGATVKDYKLPGGQSFDTEQSKYACVQLESGEEIRAKLMIGADGFKSMLRSAANIPTISWNYNHVGVVASVRLAEPTENNVAWQRFLKTGPIALLPLSNEYCNLIWSTTPEESKHLMMLPEESFVDAVNHAFWSDEHKNSAAQYTNRLFDGLLTRLGLEGSSSQQLPPTIIEVDKGSRAMFPLSLCHATQYVRSRVALIGDAAHRVHPMAGQGVNLGFGDVALLRDLLVSVVYEGKDVGSIGHLLKYETQRQRHVVVSMASVDGLYRLYGTDLTPVVLLRSLGLQATNALRPLKEKMIQFAAN